MILRTEAEAEFRSADTEFNQVLILEDDLRDLPAVHKSSIRAPEVAEVIFTVLESDLGMTQGDGSSLEIEVALGM